jgi:glutamine---fructose-6-phosphate transaminase (isomerizing)
LALELAPDVMLRQSAALATDLRTLVAPLGERVLELSKAGHWSSIDRVVATGSGDSYFAAMAAGLAFQELAGLPYTALPSLGCLYDPCLDSKAEVGRTLLLATSVSGKTPAVLRVLEQAASAQVQTLAITGAPREAVAQTAGSVLVAELVGLERSPGIRTHQASLLSHLLVAVGLGEERGHLSPGQAQAARQELARMADAIDATLEGLGEVCHTMASRLADCPAWMVLGSGPNLGTARYAAAKLVEGAALFAVGQDIEEWFHVERFADPMDAAVIILSVPGPAQVRASEIAEMALALGRHVVIVGADDVRHGPGHLRVAARGPMREAFSPLLYGLFVGPLAAQLARHLGRQPFQRDRPEIGQRLEPHRRGS